MTSYPTACTYPKALGNLHILGILIVRLSSYAGSWRDPIGLTSADPSNASCRASYDPAVSDELRSTQLKEYELRYRTRKLTYGAVDASSTCGATRQ
jgi:hypothetical protein